MKRKDILVVLGSVAILVIAAALIYRYFAPPSNDASVVVVIPHKVTPDFNQKQLDELKDPALHDYTPDITPSFPDKPKVF